MKNNVEVYCVRAQFGTYTDHFLNGGYVAIGWLPDNDLSRIQSRDELYYEGSKAILPRHQGFAPARNVLQDRYATSRRFMV